MAYILYEQAGKPNGKAEEYWLRAERILIEQEALLEVGESVSEHILTQANHGDTEINFHVTTQQQSLAHDYTTQTPNIVRNLQGEFSNIASDTCDLLRENIKENILSEVINYFFFGAICVVVFLQQMHNLPISMGRYIANSQKCMSIFDVAVRDSYYHLGNCISLAHLQDRCDYENGCCKTQTLEKVRSSFSLGCSHISYSRYFYYSFCKVG